MSAAQYYKASFDQHDAHSSLKPMTLVEAHGHQPSRSYSPEYVDEELSKWQNEDSVRFLHFSER
jgi:hypothetical protein